MPNKTSGGDCDCGCVELAQELRRLKLLKAKMDREAGEKVAEVEWWKLCEEAKKAAAG